MVSDFIVWCTPVFIPSYSRNTHPGTPNIHIFIPRIFLTSYPGYSYLHTPDIPTLVPRIFLPWYPGYSYPRTPDIHIFIPWIFLPWYPGYSYFHTPDIHIFIPRIFIPWCTPDIPTLVTPDILRKGTPSYPGAIWRLHNLLISSTTCAKPVTHNIAINTQSSNTAIWQWVTALVTA